MNFKAKIIIFACLLFPFSQAVAGHADSLYNVETLVADESAEVRWRTFKEGLDEVFIRISGDSIVMDKIKRPAASTYIKQYSYDPVETPVIDAEGVALNYRMTIQYNGSAMEKYLLDSGFPVWNEHRRDVVVWLAVRDGKNEYVLKDTDQSLIKTVADEAMHRRGLPDRWPIYDYKDRKILSVADIRGGFKDPVIKASSRYGKGPALTGSMIWNGSKWQSSWSLLMGESDKHWSIEEADYNKLINKAVDQAADAMGIAFAIRNVDRSQQLAAIHINVQAVTSIEKYQKVERYLSDLRAVEIAIPVAIDGKSATFEVRLRSTEADFLDLIKNGSQLVETEALKPESALPDIDSPDSHLSGDHSSNSHSSDSHSPNNKADVLDINEAGENNTETLTDPMDEKKEQVVLHHYKLIR